MTEIIINSKIHFEVDYMTKEQIKICKIIIKNKNLKDVLLKSHIEDYYSLQEKFSPGLLDFSDYDFENNTVVNLTDELLEEYEKQKDEIFYRRWPFIISIIALIVSVLGSIGSDSILGRIITQLLK